jgi:hypothetical protein
LFDLLLLRPAVRFLETLSTDEREEVRRLLDIIARDAFWDNRTKFPFQVPPAIVSIYDSGQFRIVYHTTSSVLINVWAISRSADPIRVN